MYNIKRPMSTSANPARRGLYSSTLRCDSETTGHKKPNSGKTRFQKTNRTHTPLRGASASDTASCQIKSESSQNLGFLDFAFHFHPIHCQKLFNMRMGAFLQILHRAEIDSLPLKEKNHGISNFAH